MRLERDDAKIGLLVFLALALFLGFLFQRSLSAMLKKEFHVQVRLDNASDVAQGTEVQLQGLRVGQVDAVQLARDGVTYRFLALVSLRNDILLWEGTRVQVVAKPLGGAFLDLQLPPPAARLVALAPGTTLPGSSGPTLTTLVDQIYGLTYNLNHGVEELRGSLKRDGLGAVLNHPQVSRTFQDLHETLRAFDRVARSGQGLLEHGETTLRSVDKTLAEVEKLLGNRSGDLDQITQHLTGALKEMETLGKDLNALVQKAGPNGDQAVKALERNLRSTEELLELLKAKPNRVVWGTPSAAEREAAAKHVEDARKAQGAKP